MNTAPRFGVNNSFKKSVESFMNIWGGLKKEGERPLKNALYNCMVIVVICALVAVYLVLAPFFKPLLWAFLFGAALFPLKKKLSESLHEWIENLENEEIPILAGIFMAPLNGLERWGERITEWLITNLKYIVITISSIISLRLILYFAPQETFQAIWNIIVWNHTAFGAILGSLSITIVILLLAGYISVVCLLWKPDSANYFTILGQGFWVLIVAYLCSFLGALQVPAFMLIMTYGLCGIIYDMKNDDNVRFIDRLKNTISIQNDPSVDTEPDPAPKPEEIPPERELAIQSQLNETKSKLLLNVPKTPSPKRPPKPEESLESDLYFKILFYCCLGALLWKHIWIVVLSFIPVTLYGSKRICRAVGITCYVEKQIGYYSGIFVDWLQPRRTALLPVCLPGILQLNEKIHKFICVKLKSYVDDISAVVMILILIIFVIFLSVFSFFQIYSETIAVAQLGSNLVNRTLTHRPDLIEMLPIDMQSMDDILDNAYKHGRSSLEDYIDGMFNDTDPSQAKKLKHQILSVWDRLIQSWMDRNNGDSFNGPRVSADSIKDTIDEIVNNSVTKAGLLGWVKSNVGTLLEVSESLWLVLRTNLSLLLSAIGTLFSVVLGGGHAVIKFLFHSIIFFTTLYYLLQSSQDRYAPIAININSPWGSRVAGALEDSVSSVLVATLKLALFHGLFTWLTHTVFGVHIVYLPAVLAAILAAAPFLETYWCSFPAFLDLWLSQDKFYLGVLLVLIHFIVPSNFNPIIHSEIKGGGHPYLTGLSIAGGMYLIGLEGAVLGPLLLCLLVVIFEVTMSSLRDSPITPHPHTRQSSLDDNTNEIFSPGP